MFAIPQISHDQSVKALRPPGNSPLAISSRGWPLRGYTRFDVRRSLSSPSRHLKPSFRFASSLSDIFRFVGRYATARFSASTPFSISVYRTRY